MAIILDQGAHDALAHIVGKRLRASRLAAKMGEQEVADALGHKNATQVCLAESGKGRIPPLMSLIRYADLYGVSIDYISGRVCDPLADPVETNQGAIKRAVVNSIEVTVAEFVEAVANYAVSSVSNHVGERQQIKRILERVEEVTAAYDRMKELNPDYEEDVRGSARLDGAITGLLGVVRPAFERTERERAASEILAFEASIDAEKFCMLPPGNAAKICCAANDS